MKINEIILQSEGRRLEPHMVTSIPEEDLFKLEEKIELQNELQHELQQETLYSKVLKIIVVIPQSRKEISIELGQKSISGQLNEILKKLQEKKLIEWTIKETPKSSKQKYRITQKGTIFLQLIKNEMKP
jgi:ATP-dependent DNA helicase RecG